VIEATLDEGVERLFAGVAARTVTAVVAQGDCLGERHVKAHRARDAGRHLGHL
jgi:hypothetical protein